jgi:hypothetical protein
VIRLAAATGTILLGPGAVLCACGSHDPRTWVVADLARRTAGRHAIVRTGGSGPSAQVLAALNVHPGVPGPHGEADVHLAGRVAGELLPVIDPLVQRLRWLSDDASDDRLAGWRASVAAWAERPSAPIDATTRAAVLSALEDDLDSPRALAALDAVALDPSVADGTRFETFAWADQLLGLDLARDVGR